MQVERPYDEVARLGVTPLRRYRLDVDRWARFPSSSVDVGESDACACLLIEAHLLDAMGPSGECVNEVGEQASRLFANVLIVFAATPQPGLNDMAKVQKLRAL